MSLPLELGGDGMDDERDDRRGAAHDRRDGHSRTRSDDATRDASRDAYVADISSRLRNVCQHLTDAEFASLVLDMAETRLRFADIDGQAFRRGLRRPTDAGDAP